MGAGRASVEQSGRGEDEAPRADARDPATAGREPGHLRDHLGVAAGIVDTVAADDDQGVEGWPEGGQRVVGHDGQPALRPHRSRLERRDEQLVPGVVAVAAAEHLVGPGEHLVRTGEVQGLAPGEDDDGDPALGHHDSISTQGDGVNDRLPTDSASDERGVAGLTGHRDGPTVGA